MNNNENKTLKEMVLLTKDRNIAMYGDRGYSVLFLLPTNE